LELMTGKIDVDNGPMLLKDTTFVTEKMDQSVALIRKDASLEANKAVFKKMGGDVSSENYSINFGLNSAIALVGTNASLTLNNSGIRTESLGSNGVFLAAEGAKAVLKNLTVMTTSNGASGLFIRSNGSISAKEVEITTMGAYSPALTVNVGSLTLSGGVLKTYGGGSPGIFSSGTVVVEDLIVNSEGSPCAVIDGKYRIQLKNTALNMGMKKAVLLYQSNEDSAQPGSSNFSMTGGSLDAQTGMLFYSTNTQYEVLLSGVSILNSSKNTVLLKAASDKWGRKNSNGAQGVIHLNQQEIEGNVECDKLSSCSLVLADHTSWVGAANVKNLAKNVAVTLDETSTWTLTASCYVHEFSDERADLSNIISDGNTLFYDAKNPKNAWLEGKILPLNPAGSIKPF